MLMIGKKIARAKKGDLTTGQLVEAIFAILVVIILLTIFVPLIYNLFSGNKDLNKAVIQNFNTASLILEGLLLHSTDNDYAYSTIYLPDDYSILGFGDQSDEIIIGKNIFKKPEKCGESNTEYDNPCLCLYKKTKVLFCKSLNKGTFESVDFMGLVYVSTNLVEKDGKMKVEYTKSQNPVFILNKETFKNFFQLGTTDKSTDFNNVFFIKVKIGNSYNIYAQPINKFSDLDTILAQQRPCSNTEVPCGILGYDISFSGYGGIAVEDLPVYMIGCLGTKCNNDQVCMFAEKVIRYSSHPDDPLTYSNIGVYTGKCLGVGDNFPLYNTLYDLEEGKTFTRIRQIGDDVFGGPLLENTVSYKIVEIDLTKDCGEYTLRKSTGSSLAQLGKNCNGKNCVYSMELYSGESQRYNPDGRDKTVNKILPIGVCK
ncbi:MAG: hypothetical protein QXG00_00270 [Candidatus Woesearchaeota archaeon]